MAESKDLWRETVGRKGVSRVTVYERYEGSNLYIEWWLDGQRHQRVLSTVAGHPVTDRRLAVKIAQKVSAEQEQLHNRRARKAMFGPEVGVARNLGQLLEAYHEAFAPDWSTGHRRDQDRHRAFWLGRLGADVRLVAVNEAMVEQIASAEARERAWSPRTLGAYLKYMQAAYNFACDKLKWIGPEHKLTGLDVPKPRSKGRAYSEDELRDLLPALGQVDPLAEWIGHTLWQTGRRLTAAATLPKAAVALEDGHAAIQWPEDTDKARQGGESLVVGRAYDLLVQLMKRPGKYVAGKAPPSIDVLQDWINKAEEIAEIPHKKGRAWHGIKRRFAGATEGMPGRDGQAGTREDTLSRVYDPKDDREKKLAVARLLDAAVTPR